MFCLAAVTSVLVPNASAPDQSRWSREQWKRWLESEHQRVQKDSERLVELAHQLGAEAKQRTGNPVLAAWLDRIRDLETRAVGLQESVAKIDENFLSVAVVQEARAIELEVHELRETWQESPESKRLKPMCHLAREMEKKADAIADRMRMP